MNLHQLLTTFSYEQLQHLSDEFGLVSLSPSTRKLVQEILDCYRDDSFVAQLLAEIPASCRGFLQSLLLFHHPESECISVPHSLLRCWFGTEELSSLLPLFEKGLLFHQQEGQNGQLLMPSDLRTTLTSMLNPKVSNLEAKMHHPYRYEPRQNQALDSMYHLLSLLEHFKAPITQKGSLHRKVYESFGKRFHQNLPAEKYFQRIVQFSLNQGYLVERHKALHSTPEANQWFELHEMEMVERLWSFFLQEWLLEKPLFQQFLLFLHVHFKDVSDTLPFYPLDEMIEEFAHRIQDRDNESNRNSDIQECIQELDFLGLIQIKQHDSVNVLSLSTTGMELFFHHAVTKSGMFNEPCMLQPNFDLLVPPTVAYSTLWKIEQIADYIRRDVMTQYRISQSSIMHAMRRSWNQEEILQLLQQLSEGRMAQNVLYSIQEWCGKYGEIQLQRVILVECKSAELAEELCHIPEIQKLFDKRISDRHFAVTETELRTLRKELQDRGYEPAVLKSPLSADDSIS